MTVEHIPSDTDYTSWASKAFLQSTMQHFEDYDTLSGAALTCSRFKACQGLWRRSLTLSGTELTVFVSGRHLFSSSRLSAVSCSHLAARVKALQQVMCLSGFSTAATQASAIACIQAYTAQVTQPCIPVFQT